MLSSCPGSLSLAAVRLSSGGNEYDEARPEAVNTILAVLGGSPIGWARKEPLVEDLVLHGKILGLPPAQLTRCDRLRFSWERLGDVFSRFGSSSLQASLMPTAS